MTDYDASSAYDRWAEDYDAVRPEYPERVYSMISDYLQIADQPRVLEVGCGTGQATRQMEARGWLIQAVEPGEHLLAIAQARRHDLDTKFHCSTFEDVEIEPGSFDLVTAATSWHWTNSDVAYRKAHNSLAPGGTIALFWNAHVPYTCHASWAPIRAVYNEVAPSLAYLAPLTPSRPYYDPATELRTCGWFGDVQAHVLEFELNYTAEGFLRLIDTYASHAALDPQLRQRLHQGLRRTIQDELAGTVTKPYETLLLLGRRADFEADFFKIS